MIVDYKLKLSDILFERIGVSPTPCGMVRQYISYFIVIDGVERQTTLDTLNELMYNKKHELRKSIKELIDIATVNVENYIKENKLKCGSIAKIQYTTSVCINGVCK